MPLPAPSSGQSHDDWISTCMANPTMRHDYPKQDQRYAVCQSIWDRKGIGMSRRRYLALAEFKRMVAAGEEPGDVILRKAYTAEVEKDASDGRPLYNFTVSTE